jgi:hypothetical protein|tara:strand:+ start:4088 stop:4234 length:147 start_codon:yes stop_codon:yes gene_type:complete
MVEVLEFVFRNGYTFFGTVVLVALVSQLFKGVVIVNNQYNIKDKDEER